MDAADHSREYQDALNAQALRDHRARLAAAPAVATPPGTLCRDCGAAIEPGRLRYVAAATRCAPCQTIAERRHAT